MMHIEIRTPVKGDFRAVMKGFNQQLFEALSPPGAGVQLLRFEGSKSGDVVHIRLKLLGFISQDWVSEIVEDGENDEKAWFVDRGVELPFFLGAWEHHHLVENAGPGRSVIVDDIRFRGPNRLMDYLLYPVLYAQFAYRKPIYQRIFGKA